MLEYNVRFGDPETEALMLLLSDETDLAAVLLVSLTRITYGGLLNSIQCTIGLRRTTARFRPCFYPPRLRCLCDTSFGGLSWELCQK